MRTTSQKWLDTFEKIVGNFPTYKSKSCEIYHNEKVSWSFIYRQFINFSDQDCLFLSSNFVMQGLVYTDKQNWRSCWQQSCLFIVWQMTVICLTKNKQSLSFWLCRIWINSENVKVTFCKRFIMSESFLFCWNAKFMNAPVFKAARKIKDKFLQKKNNYFLLLQNSQISDNKNFL